MSLISTSSFLSAQLEFGGGVGVNYMFPIALTSEVYKPSIGPELQFRVKDGKFFEGMLAVGWQNFKPLQDEFVDVDPSSGFVSTRTYSNLRMVPLFVEGRFYIPNLKPLPPCAGLIMGYYYSRWDVRVVNSVTEKIWQFTGIHAGVGVYFVK